MTRRLKRDGIADEAQAAVVNRYGDIAGDGKAFAAALAEPLPACVWTNPLRVQPAELSRLLEEDGLPAEPVAWHPGAFRLPPGARPGLSWLYRAGLMQIQEEAALLSVRLLAPRPGDRILDLCAAPGNKTAQIAIALGNRGTVVANDLKVGRLAPMHAAISRLGLVNVTTTACNGATYPTAPASFDRVLVDAPCSGEGTVRKGYKAHRPVPGDFRRRLSGIQRALLSRAIALCRPGGRIVYSTCTFAPEENEAVVDGVLRDCPESVRVISVRISGLPAMPGLPGWRDQRFSPSLAGAVRLWPHCADTGGFFAVALERTGTPEHDVGPLARQDTRPDDIDLLRCFAERFGLPDSVFAGLAVSRVGHRLRLVAADHDPPVQPPAVATGLSLTRDKAAHPKIATQAAMAFGQRAQRNVVELSRQEVGLYFNRDALPMASHRLDACNGPGQLIARHRGMALGVGQLRRRGDGWMLESLFPKSWG